MVSSDLVEYKSVPTIGWGTGPLGACGAAFGSVCILLVWSNLVLDVSTLAVVGLEDKDLSLFFSILSNRFLNQCLLLDFRGKNPI
jgi:hypothetical protein